MLYDITIFSFDISAAFGTMMPLLIYTAQVW